MAFVKITSLPATNTITSDDLFVLVDDPSGTPTTKKIAVGDLLPFFQGQVGPAGPAGPAGAGIVVLGVVANPSFLPISGTTIGDAYIDASTGDLYVWDGSSWQNAGPAGAPGVGVPTGGASGEVLAKIDGTNYNTHWITLVPTGGATGEALIKNSAADFDFSFETLVPSGGSTGQTLAKVDGTDYNTQWVAPFAIINAKGDLIAGTADDVAARVPVGTNGQVLTADSAASAGVSWTTLPSSSGKLLQYVAVEGPAIDISTTSAPPSYVTALSASITPTNASNYLVLEFTAMAGVTNVGGISDILRAVYFQVYDTTNAVQISTPFFGRFLVAASTANAAITIPVSTRSIILASSTSARTYEVRYAAQGGGLSASLLGTQQRYQFTISEIEP